jgi:hypothetical protein
VAGDRQVERRVDQDQVGDPLLLGGPGMVKDDQLPEHGQVLLVEPLQVDRLQDPQGLLADDPEPEDAEEEGLHRPGPHRRGDLGDRRPRGAACGVRGSGHLV